MRSIMLSFPRYRRCSMVGSAAKPLPTRLVFSASNCFQLAKLMAKSASKVPRAAASPCASEAASSEAKAPTSTASSLREPVDRSTVRIAWSSSGFTAVLLEVTVEDHPGGFHLSGSAVVKELGVSEQRRGIMPAGISGVLHGRAEELEQCQVSTGHVRKHVLFR